MSGHIEVNTCFSLALRANAGDDEGVIEFNDKSSTRYRSVRKMGGRGERFKITK